MSEDIAQAGSKQGALLAKAHVELTGSAWANDEFLQQSACLAWEALGMARQSHQWWYLDSDEVLATFLAAFKKAYQFSQDQELLAQLSA